MSDNFEKFVRENKAAFDQKSPGADLWAKIDGKLPASSMPRATGKMFLAGAVLVTAVVVSVFVIFGGGGNEIATQPQTQPVVAQMVKLDGYNEFVQPPLSGVAVPYEHFAVKATEGGKIEMPATGTTVTVPENAFVDEAGKPVQGEVQLNVREFHNVADLIVSGIPMKFDDNGVMRDFQTAGMIDLRGDANGKPVFIAEGKELEVTMASFAAEKDYNLYFLDPVTQKWQEIGQPENAVNEEKQKQIDALPELPEKPVAPQAVEGNMVDESRPDTIANAYVKADIIDDVMAYLDNPTPQARLNQNDFKNEFDFAVDYQAFPELKPFSKIKWKATNEKLLMENRWIFDEAWSNLTLVEKDKSKKQYTLELKNTKKKFEMVVTPLLEGQDLKQALKEYKAAKAEFDIAMEARAKELALLQKQADLYRTFRAANFGIYNCDRYYSPGPNSVSISATFRIGNEGSNSKTQVYHCTGDSRALVPYYGTDQRSFIFYPGEDNALVVVSPEGNVGVFTAKDFQALDMRALKKSKKYEFKFRKLNIEIKTPADLMTAIYAGSEEVDLSAVNQRTSELSQTDN